MTQDAAIAVESPPQPKPRQRPADVRPKPQPPYAVVVFNDDQHTFEYVVEAFQKVFGYPVEQCVTLTWQIHNEGRGIVWSGAREVAELKRDQLRAVGPDFYAARKVDFPLGVTIEPLPG